MQKESFMTMFSKTVKAIAAGAILLGAVEANAAAANAKPLRVGPVQVHGALGTNGGPMLRASSTTTRKSSSGP